MKNPMDRKLEKRLSDRAVTIGREGEVAAFGELVQLLGSSSANVRRLAASALGKLAWMGVDQAAVVAVLAACGFRVSPRGAPLPHYPESDFDARR